MREEETHKSHPGIHITSMVYMFIYVHARLRPFFFIVVVHSSVYGPDDPQEA